MREARLALIDSQRKYSGLSPFALNSDSYPMIRGSALFPWAKMSLLRKLWVQYNRDKPMKWANEEKKRTGKEGEKEKEREVPRDKIKT